MNFKLFIFYLSLFIICVFLLRGYGHSAQCISVVANRSHDSLNTFVCDFGSRI